MKDDPASFEFWGAVPVVEEGALLPEPEPELPFPLDEPLTMDALKQVLGEPLSGLLASHPATRLHPVTPLERAGALQRARDEWEKLRSDLEWREVGPLKLRQAVEEALKQRALEQMTMSPFPGSLTQREFEASRYNFPPYRIVLKEESGA